MIRKIIRVHRRDSAFVYAILESLEGMASYSTLDRDGENGQDFRELALSISPGFEKEVETVLDGMRKKFPIIELSTDEDPKC